MKLLKGFFVLFFCFCNLIFGLFSFISFMNNTFVDEMNYIFLICFAVSVILTLISVKKYVK